MTTLDKARYAHIRMLKMLKSLRDKNKLSCYTAALRSGLSQSKLSKIENAKLFPSMDDVNRLSDAMGLTAAEQREFRELVSLCAEDYGLPRAYLLRGTHRALHLHAQTHGQSDLTMVAMAQIPEALRCRDYQFAVNELTEVADQDAAYDALCGQQAALRRGNYRVEFLLVESALHPVGEPAVMAEACETIMGLVSPTVKVRLVLLDRLAGTSLPTHEFELYPAKVVARLETGAFILRDMMDVRPYRSIADSLRRRALSVDDTLVRLGELAEAYARAS